MTSSDTMTEFQQPPAAGRRLLRRSRTDRVAAGVAGGLGEYFGLDPVLFRVLFATAAFFGGAGILAYFIAWAAIPEVGTQRAPVDGWMASLRARRVPVWAVVIVGGFALWGAAFSWWAPGPAFPVLAVVVLLIVFFARREMQRPTPSAPAPAPASFPVSLSKDAPAGGDVTAPYATPPYATPPNADPAGPPPAGPPPAGPNPTWVNDARMWFEESRAAARERRRRSLPIRIAVLVTLLGSLTGLAIADAVGGIQLQWYFWTILLVLALGMLVALATRRWSWSLVALVLPAAIGASAFAGSDTSLSDGIGQREWKPVSATQASYRLAFGQGVLDLRDLRVSSPARFDITLGAGQVKVIVPRSMNVTVRSAVHAGDLETRTPSGARDVRHGGFSFTRTIDPPATATGVPVTVQVNLADGDVTLERK